MGYKKLTVISDIINTSILYEIRDNFSEKNFQKPLDKRKLMCYNRYRG